MSSLPTIEAATKTVMSVQRGYRALIGNLVSREELEQFRLLDQTQARLFVADRFLASSPRVRVPGGSISIFEDRLNRLAHDVFRYWRETGPSLAAALRVLEGFKLVSSVSSLTTSRFDVNVRRLCVYFDTLVLVCPIHEGPDRLEQRYGPRETRDVEEIKAKLHIAVNVLNVAATDVLLTTDTSAPVVAVIPDFYAALDNCKEVDLNASARLIEHLLGVGVDVRDPTNTNNVLDRVRTLYKSDDRFRRVFEEVVGYEYADFLPTILRDERLKTAPFEVRTAHFLYNTGEAATDFNILSTSAIESAADPVILSHKQNIFRSYLETGAKEANSRFELARDESFIANSLLSEKLGLIEALSFEDLRILRSNGALEQTRADLRREREKFRKADYERLDVMSESFAGRIVEIIRETGRSHLERSAKLRADIRKNAVYFSGACAVGAASIALPQTMLLSALGIGYSALIGGTALEVGKALKESRNEKARFRQNPLGILYGALLRTEGAPK